MYFKHKNTQMKSTLVTLGFALFLASCTKTNVALQPTKPTVEGVWSNDNTIAIFCGGMLNWGGIAKYTPFTYKVSNDTVMWDMGDNSFAPMYVYKINVDTLYLYSLTIGTPNVMTFTKHN